MDDDRKQWLNNPTFNNGWKCGWNRGFDSSIEEINKEQHKTKAMEVKGDEYLRTCAALGKKVKELEEKNKDLISINKAFTEDISMLEEQIDELNLKAGPV